MSATDAFRRGYVPGYDCRLSTLRNTLAFHGHPLSNGMVLGLSGALCFSYADPERNRLPFATVAGVSDQTLEGTSAALNLYLHRGRHDPDHPGAPLFRDYLASGVPVNVAVYRPALKRAQFRGRKVAISDATAVGFHYVTLTEHHPETGEYTVFETDNAAPFRVTDDELAEAWFWDRAHFRPVRDPYQPCDGLWYALHAPASVDGLLPASIRHAAARVAHGFFYPQAKGMGEPGLHRFAADAAGWGMGDEDPNALAQGIAFLRILEHWLTGGGFGRRLYGRFLSEASGMLGDARLRELARRFGDTAARWTALVQGLAASAKSDWAAREFSVDTAAVRGLVATHVPAIVEMEMAQMHALAEWAA